MRKLARGGSGLTMLRRQRCLSIVSFAASSFVVAREPEWAFLSEFSDQPSFILSRKIIEQNIALTSARITKSSTTLIDPVERSNLSISTHFPLMGDGSLIVGPNQKKRIGVLRTQEFSWLDSGLKDVV